MDDTLETAASVCGFPLCMDDKVETAIGKRENMRNARRNGTNTKNERKIIKITRGASKHQETVE
jgi:hypothetical protein